ncbi:peptide/nickel transport system substrate-binding protein [Microlunatus sagamiharensis]|uniref:Peptide/nickel transport system substrate-binding protein n=1 Tax=Microlunatus sagamiharensis TaxID=546874 RepID=A0A1H2LRW8_9ACTN|nr:ABC transporter substrate-binding protein [Microlunatus sagamiharensis]SDU83760.1 peptide/nickel transport system substrate-binding protein [Microlunatus sagamiharensis]
MSYVPTRRRLLALGGGVAASALLLAACGGGGSSSAGSSGGTGGSASGSIVVGTTDKITSLDPAGSYDNGSFAVMNQVYPFLLNTPYGSPDVQPDIATSAEFTSPTEYTVKLKPGLKWANGHDLTSSDVKFTFDRDVKIADPNGPSSLLSNLDSVSTPDATTVVFKLKAANDQTFAQVLSSPAGPIVDEEVFSPDAVTPDKTIVDGKAFAGQYTIASYDVNNLIQYKAYEGYQGLLGPAKTGTVNVKYYADASNMKLEVSNNSIDVAFRSLSANDIADLRTNDKVKVVDGPGGEIRYMVFNFDTMPYGAKTSDADNAKSLAVRQAVADLVDRSALSDQVYKGTYTPLFSQVPKGLTGANEAYKELYGDGNGAPSVDKAKQALSDAGVSTPVDLKLQYNTDHYGPGSTDEYGLIKTQLESSGLFKVDLQSTEYVQYSKDRVKDAYPVYQLGWFPDYSDADNYLTPFFSKNNFVANHYDSAPVQKLIGEQLVETDKTKRADLIGQIQTAEAKDISTLPLLQGSQVAVVGSNVSGADQTLDASFKFRYAALSKS